MKQTINCIAVGTLAALLVSCSSYPKLESQLPPNLNRPKSVTQPVYRIKPGDELEVKYHFWPEMNTTQIVRPDGKISLELLDDIGVAGMKIQEADDKITSMYTDKLRNPEIAIIPVSLSAPKIYVGGQVNSPGPIDINPNKKTTVLQALMMAGGLNYDQSNMKNVLIVRRIDEKIYATSLNAKDLVTTPNNQDYILEPEDIVFVTRTGIAEANQFVEQYINEMIPDNVTRPAALWLGSD